MNPEWLRYYIAAKLNANVEDIDFNPDDFVARVNSDLVGKYVNIASRTAGFITKRFGGRLSGLDPAASELTRDFQSARAVLVAHRTAVRGARIRQGDARDRRAARPREPVHRREQAVGARQGRKRAGATARGVLARASTSSGISPCCCGPCCPQTARKVQALLRLDGRADAVGSACRAAGRSRIAAYEHLMTRAEPKQLDALFGLDEAAAKPDAQGAAPADVRTERRRSHGRRLREARSAHREDRRCRSRGRRGQAAEADARHRRRSTHGVRRHSLRVRARAAARPPDAGARESQAAQDALRRFRRHGAGGAGPGGKDIFLLAPDAARRRG